MDHKFDWLIPLKNSLYIAPIYNWGNDDQKEKWVRNWASGGPHGGKIGCFGLSEPGNGSDAGAASTTGIIVSLEKIVKFVLATKVDGGYILNGTKMWITNSYESEAGVVFATSDKSQKHKVSIRDLRTAPSKLNLFHSGHIMFCISFGRRRF